MELITSEEYEMYQKAATKAKELFTTVKELLPNISSDAKRHQYAFVRGDITKEEYELLRKFF